MLLEHLPGDDPQHLHQTGKREGESVFREKIEGGSDRDMAKKKTDDGEKLEG